MSALASWLGAAQRRWETFWHAPIDPAPLALFRQAFAWSMLIYFVAWSFHAKEWLTDAGYHPSLAVDPVHGPRLPLMPLSVLPVAGVIFFGALLAYIFGFARKIVVWILLAAAIYVMCVDPISAFTLNRLYVVGLFVLAVAPDPEPVVVDAQTGAVITAAAALANVGAPGATHVPHSIDLPDLPADESLPTTETVVLQRAWPTRMLQLMVVVQYFGAGLCKTIDGDWWGGQDVLFVQVQGFYMTDAAAWMVRNLPYWTWRVQQELALWFELLAPLLFGVRRLRPVAFGLGLGLHVIVAVTMHLLIYFSLQMACFYALFLPPEWTRRFAPDA